MKTMAELEREAEEGAWRTDVFTERPYVAAGLGFDENAFTTEVEAFRTYGTVPEALPCTRRSPWLCTLTPDQLTTIARKYEQGHTGAALGAVYGVSPVTIMKAVRLGQKLLRTGENL